MTSFWRFLLSPSVLLTYAIMMTVVVVALVHARGRIVRQYATVGARADWQRWRDVARRQSAGDGPVQRREPASTEPPALVLMREHFVACTALAVTMTSALFVTLAYALRGVIRSPRVGRGREGEQP
jgi:hypothetical protein